MTHIDQYIHGVEKVNITEVHHDDFKTLRVTIKTKDGAVQLSLFTDSGLPPSFEFGYNYMEKEDESEEV